LRTSRNPSNSCVVVRKLSQDEVSEGEGEGEDNESDQVQYCCEQLIVGNRKTKIVQKKSKTKKENNRRILKKRFIPKKKQSNELF